MLKSIVEKCKANRVNPWDVEMTHCMGNRELTNELSLTEDEKEIFSDYNDEQLKKVIFEVYYESKAPELPEHIIELINQARQETNYEGWGLTSDWLEGVNDFPFDKEMCNFVKGNDNQVYGYILSLEV